MGKIARLSVYNFSLQYLNLTHLEFILYRNISHVYLLYIVDLYCKLSYISIHNINVCLLCLIRFERCGIISNIRTHLRQNLVNALKGKDLGLCQSREARSAKQYVHDMLIAEYLFSHNYSFTLSIFASEVPLLVNFRNSVPQRSDDNDRDGSSRLKLQSDYIEHTLETLGINPKRPEGQYIISSYLNSEAPLLLSILNCINSLVISTKSSVRENIQCDKGTQANLALEANIVDVTKMQTIRRKIMQQKQLYDDELKTKESKLKHQASVIKHQLGSMNAKLEEAQVIHSTICIFRYF